MFETLRTTAHRTLTQRTIRALLADCRRLLSERGQANSVAIAMAVVGRIAALDGAAQRMFFDKLATEFSPDPALVLAHAQAYAREPSADNLIALTNAVEPPRQELLRRINRAPGGTAAIVRLRRALLEHMAGSQHLRAVDADLLHLLASWFNPGFLEMRKVDWNSPAQLLEELIEHEAVHAIDGWADLRRRLLPDRRCFAFFHPQLPGRPLIFVEIALLAKMPAAIAPLIDKAAKPAAASETFKVAAFYSISNCEPGLRGVSLGNFLIKRVAEELKGELPKLSTFCTLSPIPGFVRWLASGRVITDLAAIETLKPDQRAAYDDAFALLGNRCHGDFGKLAAASVDGVDLAAEDVERALVRLCAAYLAYLSPGPAGDAVARFHLDNGARLERINARADLSPNGLRQSAGLMVNYLYDLDRIEVNHEQFKSGIVAHSRAIGALL